MILPANPHGVLYAISEDGIHKEKYLEEAGGHLSSNSKNLVLMGNYGSKGIVYLFDAAKNEIVDEAAVPEDFKFESWSPDFDLYASTCSHGLICVYSVQEASTTSLPPPHQGEGINFDSIHPEFSPDGKWIAYYSMDINAKYGDPGGGVFITPTSCIDQPETCFELTQGPVMPFELAHKFV
ncbi:MAG: hypothetical protein DWQ07_01205 [Chloroflexi bacterium]|nr:MAG: hypothetical protein DWQ07_01205 [Chloroflexota bacterium]MBL1196499.1 hypothetical protein [Chloroflexota bacterium]